jgi:hypothetical protein
VKIEYFLYEKQKGLMEILSLNRRLAQSRYFEFRGDLIQYISMMRVKKKSRCVISPNIYFTFLTLAMTAVPALC